MSKLKDCFNFFDDLMTYKSVRNFVFAMTAIIGVILGSGIIAQVSGNWQSLVGKVLFFIIVGLAFFISFSFTVWGCFRCNSGYDELPSDVEYV